MSDSDYFTKTDGKYHCNLCNTTCVRNTEWHRHISTRKHQTRVQCGEKTTPHNAKKYVCTCKKEYNDRAGLWRHKQKCSGENQCEKSQDDKAIDKEMVLMLLQQNNEFKDLLKEQSDLLMEQAKEHQRQLFELAKNGNNNSITNNITNNNNQKFNMNFFLNEQCKDALDIMDFVNSLQLSVTDLENTGNVGYVKGVSDIFLRGLRDLDVYKRPIHCSDLKREVMYIKDNDVWEKDEDNKKVKKAIQYIGGKNFKQVNEWVALNPESKDVRSRKHDQYVKILTKCTGGADIEEDDTLFGKVITNVAKEVLIDKNPNN
jgi:hypothetical protein